MYSKLSFPLNLLMNFRLSIIITTILFMIVSGRFSVARTETTQTSLQETFILFNKITPLKKTHCGPSYFYILFFFFSTMPGKWKGVNFGVDILVDDIMFNQNWQPLNILLILLKIIYSSYYNFSYSKCCTMFLFF